MVDAITDPTGGAPNFNIEDVFKSFGYTPTQAEINALAPAFEGRTNVGQTGLSAVSNYVIAHQQVQGAQSLIQGQLSGAEDALAQSQVLGTTAQGTLQSAADVYSQAPQLFGSLTPDQISSYLKPLQNQFDYGLGAVQGAAADRGLGGSSLEATAMSQAQTQYQQQVLQQALQLGLQQQQNRAGALTNLGNTQASLSQGGQSTYASLINSLLGQNMGAAEGLAQLPGAATNQALAQQATLQDLNPKQSSPWGGIAGTGLGALLGSFGGPVGAGIGASLGGAIGSSVTGNPTGANVGNKIGTASLLASLFGKGGGLPSWGSLFGGSGSSGTSGLIAQGTGAAGPSGPSAGDSLLM